MRKRLIAGVVLAVVASAVTAGVVVVVGQGGAGGEPEHVLPPRPENVPEFILEWERVTQEEEAKAKFDGVVNGIRLYPSNAEDPPEWNWACKGTTPEEREYVTLDAVAGTPMEIIPTYLPPGAEEVDALFPPVICKGVVASVGREWIMREEGADFRIHRRQGERVVDTSASADRVSAATVAGKPAVLVAPLTPDGYGYSRVIMAEDFGFTSVGAFGLPLEETIKIAEGLE
jgi:hypothetical protein